MVFVLLAVSNCATFTQGERIYQQRCANCHGNHGEGLASLYPALENSLIIRDQPSLLPCIILNGKYTLDSAGNKISEMPAIPDLGEVEMSNLINFLMTLSGSDHKAVSIDSVRIWRSGCN